MRPVPVDREQHRAEHDGVVPVEPVADGGEQVLTGAGRVPVAPGGDRGAGLGQVPQEYLLGTSRRRVPP